MMKVLYGFACICFAFLGCVTIIQSIKSSVAKEAGKFVQATVKKKVENQFGVQEIKVSYDHKEYWVKVTQQKFSTSNLNRHILLKYNANRDLIVDDGTAKNNWLPGILFLAASAWMLLFGIIRPIRI
jgi:hypothetical protein